MKKLLLILLMIPVITSAATCDVEKDAQTSIERNLVCDAEKSTVTTFNFPGDVSSAVSYRCNQGELYANNLCKYTASGSQKIPKCSQGTLRGNKCVNNNNVVVGTLYCEAGYTLIGSRCVQEITRTMPATPYCENGKLNDARNECILDVVLENSVCTVTCEEEIVFSVDPIKKVLAGTGFSYPLYASGERKCKAVYDYEGYENKIRQLISEYNSLSGNNKTQKGRELTNYYAEKQECDEFSTVDSEYYNKYEFHGNVDLTLEVSEEEYVRDETIQYRFVNIDEYDSNTVLDEIYFSGCNYNDLSKKCEGSNSTITGWTNISRIYGKYTMDDVYLEKYTGDIKSTYSNNSCDAGDIFFTDFSSVTRPKENDTSDKGYKITLTANNIGNNLGVRAQEWKLNVDCWYQVKNLIFPQGGPGRTEDENYEEYGNMAFQYRIIDLDNPFPNREAGANWKGNEDIISANKDRLSSLQKFVISLSRTSIKDIREYNNDHNYDNYDFTDTDKSNFIIKYNEIIDRE